jgi:hypothetical protein
MPGNRVVARYSVWPARAADAVTDRLILGERIIQTPQTPFRKHWPRIEVPVEVTRCVDSTVLRETRERARIKFLMECLD